jgi:hypothetical protein
VEPRGGAAEVGLMSQGAKVGEVRGAQRLGEEWPPMLGRQG